jgi:hypothetical protein
MRYCGVIGELSREDDRFQLDGGSWTNDVSWPRGYDDILIPMQRASARFQERVLHRAIHTSDPDYRNALFHLLTSETSCYRYSGQAEILLARVTNPRQTAHNPELLLAEQPLEASEVICAPERT